MIGPYRGAADPGIAATFVQVRSPVKTAPTRAGQALADRGDRETGRRVHLDQPPVQSPSVEAHRVAHIVGHRRRGHRQPAAPARQVSGCRLQQRHVQVPGQVCEQPAPVADRRSGKTKLGHPLQMPGHCGGARRGAHRAPVFAAASSSAIRSSHVLYPVAGCSARRARRYATDHAASGIGWSPSRMLWSITSAWPRAVLKDLRAGLLVPYGRAVGDVEGLADGFQRGAGLVRRAHRALRAPMRLPRLAPG